MASHENGFEFETLGILAIDLHDLTAVNQFVISVRP